MSPSYIFDAVFITGIVRNCTTRYAIKASAMAEYTKFCERLTAERGDRRIDELYRLAADHLEKIMRNDLLKILFMIVSLQEPLGLPAMLVE